MDNEPTSSIRETQTDAIELVRVRTNNLREISLSIRAGDWISVCGISGSGKSSLALDTLYAEGQRRYVECLSPRTRQFIQQLSPPDADAITGIPPAIAIQPPGAIQSTRGGNGTASVSAATDFDRLLGLLFAKVATAVCPNCSAVARRDTAESIVSELSSIEAPSRFQIGYRITADGELPVRLQQAVKSGFIRVVAVGDSSESAVTLDLSNSSVMIPDASEYMVIVDRLVGGKKDAGNDAVRIAESVETALYFGDGDIVVFAQEPIDSTASSEVVIDGSPWQMIQYTTSLVCKTCPFVFPEVRPRLFQSQSATLAKRRGKANPDADDSVVERDAFQIGGLTVDQWRSLTVQEFETHLSALTLLPSQQQVAARVIGQIENRLRFLIKVGLKYLRLDRPMATLSSGEQQRLRLSSVLGSTLVNMLYVLDEPSLGMHPHELDGLMDAMGELHRRGNTLVVVDHDAQVIQSANRVIEIGPGAGVEGGEIVFDGTPGEMIDDARTATADYLAGRAGISSRSGQRRQSMQSLRVVGASGHNLKNISVDFPLECLCLVTGVSGSGKSSLLIDTLVPAMEKRKGGKVTYALPLESLTGDGVLQEIVYVDQTPIGRTGRSNPVTYVKAFDDIRKAFAETVDARTHNIDAGMFSFNVAGGRCEKCCGEGVQIIDMQFLADIAVACDACNGTRYRNEVLRVRYRNLNIAEVLQLTVREAFLFFRGQPRVQKKLKSLIDVGLEYVPLGQQATTLSTGEAQRLKLALYLNAARKNRALFVMDEPTAGLHMKDINRLLDCFDTLITAGHSIIAIEHNLQMMRNADWMIDLGPGAGDDGGQVVAAGTPEQIAGCRESVTGRFLKETL